MLRTFILIVQDYAAIDYLEHTNNLLFSDYLITTNLLKKQKITKTNLLKKQKITKTINNCKNKNKSW